MRRVGKRFVMALVEGKLSHTITFGQHPKSAHYLLALRNRVNREIAARQ